MSTVIRSIEGRAPLFGHGWLHFVRKDEFGNKSAQEIITPLTCQQHARCSYDECHAQYRTRDACLIIDISSTA
eukprot:scaffold15862_cov100-Skeletonema_dohrnii-CCMP3373.AAC.1